MKTGIRKNPREVYAPLDEHIDDLDELDFESSPRPELQTVTPIQVFCFTLVMFAFGFASAYWALRM